MPTLNIGGVRIAYEQGGTGDEHIVLLHGGSGRGRSFEPLVALLPSGWRWTVPDLRGHGASSHLPGHYRVDEVAADIAALIERAIGKPVVVLGHSYGGHVALTLAAERARLIKGLIVGDAPLTLTRLREHIEGDVERLREWQRLAACDSPPKTLADRLEQLPVTVPGQTAAVAARDVYGPGHPWFKEMGASLLAHDPDFLAAIVDRFDDTYAALDGAIVRVSCPTLLLWADPAVGGLLSGDEVATARRTNSQVSVVRLAGVGHGLHLEAPDRVAGAIRAFLTSLESRADPLTSLDTPRSEERDTHRSRRGQSG